MSSERKANSERLVSLRNLAETLSQQIRELAKELGKVQTEYLSEYRLAQQTANVPMASALKMEDDNGAR